MIFITCIHYPWTRLDFVFRNLTWNSMHLLFVLSYQQQLFLLVLLLLLITSSSRSRPKLGHTKCEVFQPALILLLLLLIGVLLVHTPGKIRVTWHAQFQLAFLSGWWLMLFLFLKHRYLTTVLLIEEKTSRLARWNVDIMDALTASGCFTWHCNIAVWTA